MRPRRQRAFSAHQGWKLLGQPVQVAAGQRMGALARRAEGGGSGRVENKIASVVVAQGLQQLACRLRFYRKNGSQLVVVKLLQGRVSQYASGMNRSGNAAVGRQIVKNRGQLPGIAHITTADARLPALRIA